MFANRSYNDKKKHPRCIWTHINVPSLRQLSMFKNVGEIIGRVRRMGLARITPSDGHDGPERVFGTPFRSIQVKLTAIGKSVEKARKDKPITTLPSEARWPRKQPKKADDGDQKLTNRHVPETTDDLSPRVGDGLGPKVWDQGFSVNARDALLSALGPRSYVCESVGQVGLIQGIFRPEDVLTMYQGHGETEVSIGDEDLSVLPDSIFELVLADRFIDADLLEPCQKDTNRDGKPSLCQSIYTLSSEQKKRTEFKSADRHGVFVTDEYARDGSERMVLMFKIILQPKQTKRQPNGKRDAWIHKHPKERNVKRPSKKWRKTETIVVYNNTKAKLSRW